MKSKLIVASVVLMALMVGVSSIAAQTPSLAGSWQLTLTPSPNPAPSVVEPAILALATFTTDGSVIESDSSQVAGVPSTARSSRGSTAGHGIWQPAPVPGNLFVRFISLIVNPNGTLYLQKTVTINGAMDASGNNFSGSYSFTLTNPIGGFAGGGSGTVAGQRIPHPLLP
jgi:hypothetical protein